MADGIKWAAAARTAAMAIAVLTSLSGGTAYADSSTSPIIVTAVPAPNLFGTGTVQVNLSRYAPDWHRAKLDATSHPAMQRLIAPARGLGRTEQVAYIQAAVHSRIRWRSDATEWGLHDYWASAAETLERGAGDMEDRAILKMQALRALGFAPRDLVLTLGRDRVGGVIAILIVRIDHNRRLTLDDLGGAPIAIERREGFEPMLSFVADRAWLHGRLVLRTGVAAAGK